VRAAFSGLGLQTPGDYVIAMNQNPSSPPMDLRIMNIYSYTSSHVTNRLTYKNWLLRNITSQSQMKILQISIQSVTINGQMSVVSRQWHKFHSIIHFRRAQTTRTQFRTLFQMNRLPPAIVRLLQHFWKICAPLIPPGKCQMQDSTAAMLGHANMYCCSL